MIRELLTALGDRRSYDPLRNGWALFGLAYVLLSTGRYPHMLDSSNLGQWLGLLPPWDLVAFGMLFGGWTIGLLRSTRAADRPS